ncbi:MAG: flagellar basal body P-ring formation chaperone FlgA [Bdellovibrionia bacterium]
MKTVFVSLLLLGFVNAWAAEVSISVRPQTLIRGETLTLGDIAVFEGFSLPEASTLKKIALGNAPAFGEKRNYSNQALTEILRAHLKSSEAAGERHIKLQIPSEVSVEGGGLAVSSQAVRANLQEGLKKLCDSCEYKIEDLRLPELPAFPPKSEWSVRADYQKLRGPFNIPLEIINPAGEKSVFWVTGRLSVWKRVPVAARLLSQQDRIEPSDIKWLKREITFLPDTTPSEQEITQAGQLKTAVGPEQVILQSHLLRKRALNRGEIVTLTTGTTVWNLTLKGVAQEPGYVGDTVRVLNTETKKVVMGRVVAQGVVEVK